MPYYATSQEWLRQSQLLLEAQSTTTRITTKYKITSARRRIPKNKPVDDKTKALIEAAAKKPPRGKIILKTYDPVSGVVLKYKTTKAAEVSRLILCLGKLSRPMAGLPELKDEVMADAPADEAAATAASGSRAGTPGVEKSEANAAPGGKKQQQPSGSGVGGGGGGSGKGKKKKGKK